MGQTGLNYTGQRLDGTGLLYYHARMYDPVLARFVSADSVVPGNASGSLDGIALKPLTVDFHEVGFGAMLHGENGQPFWFQLSDDEKQKAGSPWGPANPQALNRYSYVLNGPMKATDPSGHYESGGDSWAGYRSVCGNQANQRVSCGDAGAKVVTDPKDPNKGELVETWTYDQSTGTYHYEYYWSESAEFKQFKDFADRARDAELAFYAAGGAALVSAAAAAIGCPSFVTGIGAAACVVGVIGAVVSVAAAKQYADEWYENLQGAQRVQKLHPGVSWSNTVIQPHNSVANPYSREF